MPFPMSAGGLLASARKGSRWPEKPSSLCARDAWPGKRPSGRPAAYDRGPKLRFDVEADIAIPAEYLALPPGTRSRTYSNLLTRRSRRAPLFSKSISARASRNNSALGSRNNASSGTWSASGAASRFFSAASKAASKRCGCHSPSAAEAGQHAKSTVPKRIPASAVHFGRVVLDLLQALKTRPIGRQGHVKLDTPKARRPGATDTRPANHPGRRRLHFANSLSAKLCSNNASRSPNRTKSRCTLGLPSVQCAHSRSAIAVNDQRTSAILKTCRRLHNRPTSVRKFVSARPASACVANRSGPKSRSTSLTAASDDVFTGKFFGVAEVANSWIVPFTQRRSA